MSKLRNAVIYIISFLLMFALLSMQVSFFLKTRMLNGSFYKKVLGKSDYYSLIEKEIDFGFKNLSMVTSIPEEVFSESVSKEAVKALSYKNIDSAEGYMKYKGEYSESKIDTNKLYNNLEKYVQDNKLNGELKSQLTAVAKDAGKIIESHAALFSINSVAKYSQFQSFRRVLFLAYKNQLLTVMVTAILILFLVLINWQSLRKVLLWVGSSLIASSLMTIIPCILAIYFKIAYKYAIDIPSLKIALRAITLGYINYFLSTGVLFFLVGIMCMVIYSFVDKRERTKAYVMRRKARKSFN